MPLAGCRLDVAPCIGQAVSRICCTCSSGRPPSASSWPSSPSPAPSTGRNAWSRAAPKTATATVAEPRHDPPPTWPTIYADAAPAVAYIEAGQGSGSGFLIDGQGHIVTNEHVVEAGSEYTVTLGTDGEELPAKLIGEDASTDLAVLEVDPQDVPAEVKPLDARLLRRAAPGRRGDRHRQPVRPLGHRHHRHHLRARPRDRLAQRLHHPRRRADRRRDQPRQLGRPAARRAGPRDRRQLADRLLLAPVQRRRLRRRGRHGQGGRPAADRGRRDRARLPRRLLDRGARLPRRRRRGGRRRAAPPPAQRAADGRPDREARRPRGGEPERPLDGDPRPSSRATASSSRWTATASRLRST